MVHFIGPDKHRSEVVQIPFDFTAQVPAGTVITSDQCVCTVTVFSGTDASPQDILSGLPSVSNDTWVYQRITLGVIGVIYQVNMTVSLDDGTVYPRDCYVAIVIDDPQVTPPAPSPPDFPIHIFGTPPNGEVGVAYTFTFTCDGGTGTGYVFTVDSGSVPTGTALNVTTTWTDDTVAGTPTVAGTFNFVPRVTDSGANTTTEPASITILRPLYGYVANTASSTVTVLDRSYTPVTTIITVPNNDSSIFATPDRQYAFLNGTTGRVFVINADSLTVTDTINTGAAHALNGCTGNHDSTKVYVSAQEDQKIYTIDVASKTVVDTWTVPDGGLEGCKYMAIHPTLDILYTNDPAGHTIQALDFSGNVLHTITAIAQGIAISPDGTRIGAGVYGGFAQYSTANYASLGSVNYRGTTSGPNQVAFTLDGTKAYVTDSIATDTAVIDIASTTVLGYVTIGSSNAQGIWTHPDTGKIYICAAGSNLVKVVDPSIDLFAVQATITAGSEPYWITFPPP